MTTASNPVRGYFICLPDADESKEGYCSFAATPTLECTVSSFTARVAAVDANDNTIVYLDGEWPEIKAPLSTENPDDPDNPSVSRITVRGPNLGLTTDGEGNLAFFTVETVALEDVTDTDTYPSEVRTVLTLSASAPGDLAAGDVLTFGQNPGSGTFGACIVGSDDELNVRVMAFDQHLLVTDKSPDADALTVEADGDW